VSMKLPGIVPLRATLQREPFDNPDWIFELKHDGFRSLAYVNGDGCRLISRRNNDFKRFLPLNEALSTLPVKNAILDGELVCIDDQGRSLFNQLLFRRGQPYFYAFDLLWLNGQDLRSLRLIERKESLKKLIMRSKSPSLLYADHVDGYGIDFFRMVCEKNLEGIVAKHRSSLYDASAKWIKIKNPTYTQTERRHELFESLNARVKRRISA